MATQNAGITFGATIIPPPHRPHEQPLPSPTTLDPSTALMSGVSHDNPVPDNAEQAPMPEKALSPFSPFYQHPPASFERVHSHANSKTNLGISEKDLESGAVTPLSLTDENPFGSKASADCNAEDKMWPSRRTLIMERKAEKCKRRQNGWCAPVQNRWSQMSKGQRLAAKIGLALFIAGVAVAVGVGISVAVHGNVYASKGNSNQIGHT